MATPSGERAWLALVHPASNGSSRLKPLGGEVPPQTVSAELNQYKSRNPTGRNPGTFDRIIEPEVRSLAHRGLHVTGMSTAKNAAKRSRAAPKTTVEAGGMLDTCSELAGFIADGVLAYLKDESCLGDTRRDCPAAYKGKGGILTAARLLNKDIQSELDARIKVLMEDVCSKIISYREARLKFFSIGRQRLGQNFREYDPIMDEERSKKDAVKQDLQKMIVPLFGEHVRNKIIYDLDYNAKTVHLAADVGTFMAMVTQRCQIHGALPLANGHQRCRNLCNTLNNDNFSLITVGDYHRCVFAREKCMDQQCIVMTPRYLSHGDNSITCNTARAMFRARGVMPPYDPVNICHVVGNWGHGDDPRSQDWPKKIFLTDHPLVKGGYSSLQSALKLSDKQVEVCKADAIRKHNQKKNKEKAMVELSVSDLMDDLDAELKHIDIPITGVNNMKEDYTAVYNAIHVAVRMNHTFRHVMEICMVRNALDTLCFMLGDVVEAEVREKGKVSSSEAYEFVSGMHVGRYQKVSPAWGYHYGMLNQGLTYKIKEVQMQDIIKALEIFDAMDESSLLVAKTRDHDRIPKAFSICTSQGSFTFDARLYDWDEALALHNDIEELMQREENENKFPPLYSKRTHSDVYKFALSGDKQSKEFRDYVLKMFKATVADYGTRCAALDILHLTPGRMVAAIAEKRGPSQQPVSMARTNSDLSLSE